MYTIGQLAESCGVPTSAIRFWERRGLLSEPVRVGGQRRYTEDSRAEVALLKLCQDAGFTLSEIRELGARREVDLTSWRDMVKAKIADVEENLRKLQHTHEMLAHALECPERDITQCPRFCAALDRRLSSDASETIIDHNPSNARKSADASPVFRT